MLTKRNINQTIKENLSSVIIYSLLPLLLIFCIVAANEYFSSQEKLAALKTEVDTLKAQSVTLTNNKQLVANNLDDYNLLLSHLIPDTEDFFSITLALERLSALSGFNILRYNIVLSSSTREKLSLTIEGDGNADSFLTFLENYQFAGGRLVTNEKLEFSTNSLGKIKLALNFYTKKNPTVTGTMAKLTPEDIKTLTTIKEKTSFLLTPSTDTDDGQASNQYDTKTDPF